MTPKIVEIMTELFLKSGVLWPRPVGLVAIAHTAVRSNLQKDQQPVAYFVFMKFHRRADLFQQLVHATAKKF